MGPRNSHQLSPALGLARFGGFKAVAVADSSNLSRRARDDDPKRRGGEERKENVTKRAKKKE